MISTSVDASPAATFEIFAAELSASWRRAALTNPTGPQWDGEPTSPIRQADRVIGRVEVWEPGTRLVLKWSAAADSGSVADVAFETAAGSPGRTMITIRLIGAQSLLQAHPLFDRIEGADSPGVLGWFTERIAAPAIGSGSPVGIENIVRDRQARWPEGSRARKAYSGSDKGPHAMMARAVLDALHPGPSDTLLEVGCGAGVSLLPWALQRGCTAAGLDHSATLLKAAAERNRPEIDDNRLRLVEADAARMPFQDEEFSKIGMVQVLMLLDDPVGVLAECRRVLQPGGVVVSIVGVEPESRPTENVEAHRAREDGRLREQAKRAGFADIEVTWNDFGGQLLRCRA